MSTRRPPIAPKSGQQSLGPVEGLQGQQIVLESHTPSPRKSSLSDHGNSLGATRPRSPRPADVYNAAMAELIDGDGRGLTKIRVSGPSPASSPGRRRAVHSLTTSSINALNPLSPGRSSATASILDQSGSGGLRALNMTFSGVGVTGPGSAAITSASARVLSALDEHRQVLMSPPDSMSSTAPLQSTPARKATSAPDSQSAQMRSAVNPWRSGLHEPLAHIGSQPYHQSPRAAAAAARHQGGAPASPPLHGGLHLVPVPPPPPVAWGAVSPAPPAAPPPILPALPPSGPLAAAMAAAAGSGGGGTVFSVRQRRDSASSTESPSPGHLYESPSAGGSGGGAGLGLGGGFAAALRVATFSRVGSPNSPSPSTPVSSSQPHTPSCSSLKPRPPEAPSSGRAASRKYSHLVSPEARQQQQQQQQAMSPLQQQQSQYAGSPGTGRLPLSANTTPGAPTPDDPPTNPLFRRSLSMGASAAAQVAAAAAASGGSGGGGLLGGVLSGGSHPNGSMPGTPSASRPTSGRASSARLASRPVAALVDAVRSKDEGKLVEVLEVLRGPHGITQGLNERHNVTGRTPLHEAVITNSVDMVGALLAAGADPNIGHLTQGPPLLHCAAFGEVETMRLLLKEGADVTATDVERTTALHFACVGGHLDAARLLLDYGGDLRARNEDDLAPLDLAPPEFPRRLLLMAQQQGAAAAAFGGGSAAGRLPPPAPPSAATAAGAASPPLPSPPLLGRSYRSAGGAAASAAGAAGGGGGDPGGVGLALSPERPLSSSSRPTSGSVPVLRTTDPPSSAGGSDSAARRGAHSAGARPGGGGGGSASNGPLSSPTSQIDLGQSPAFPGSGGANLRPLPPPEPGSAGGAAAPTAGTAGGGGGLRSRRNSSTALGAAAAAAAAAAAGADDSPLRTGGASAPTSARDGASTAAPSSSSAAAAASTGAPRSRGAPASPLLGGEAEAVPASPPQLQLPGGVRRQLSRGAELGDIIQGFQKEDAEIVRRSLSGTSREDLLAGAHPGAQLQQQQQQPLPHFQPPPGIPAGPSAAMATKGKHPGIIGTGAPAAPVFGRAQGPASHPQQQPQQHLQQQAGGQQQQQQQQDQQQQQPLLPFNLPETAVICFGTRLQVHAAQTDGEDSATSGGSGAAADGDGSAAAATTAAAADWDAAAATFGRQLSGAMAMPSFSAGLAPASGVVVAAPITPDLVAPGQASSSASPAGTTTTATTMTAGSTSSPPPPAAFTPVPATGFMPPAAAFKPPAAATASPEKPEVAEKVTSGAAKAAAAKAAPAGRMSGSGDDFAAATPPLVRDDSPVRSRSSTDGTAGAGDGTGAGGGHGGGHGGGRGGAGARGATTRTSLLAAQALKRMSNMNASTDAIEVRAAALFRQSTDLTTGEMAWTRGELLGEGAYGKVYAGLNQQTGELMAVKVLQLVSKHGNKEAAMQQLEALQHEMSLYKKLKNKHVVGYIDARFEPKTWAFYIFLEYVPGGSIASMLNRFGRFSEELVRNYTRQLLIGLEYLHGCKIVHRDLKGGNVLVSRDGVVKLADFGASKAYRDHTITDCMKSVRGSVFWMAPEVIRGTGYGRRADIWSLGCTVIEMVTGKHPWPHLDNQWTAMFTIAKTEEGPPRPANLSPEGQRFLDKCLQFDPAKRPTATELLQDPFVARLGPGAGAAGGEDRLQHSF